MNGLVTCKCVTFLTLGHPAALSGEESRVEGEAPDVGPALWVVVNSVKN